MNGGNDGGVVEGTRVYELYFPPVLKVMLAAMAVVFVAAAAALFCLPLVFPNANTPPLPVALLFVGVLVVNAAWMLSIPHRMILHQDGTIEFISVLRQRVIRAAEIDSIKPEGTTYGFVILRAGRAKVRLLTQFDGFHDFLTRLKAMNPGIELRGC
jgi:hypothetical protein